MKFLSGIFRWGAAPKAEEPPPPPVIDLGTIDKMTEEEVIAAIKSGLAKGAQADAVRAGWGNPPLHQVCHYGFTDAAKLLLDAGAAVNGKGDTDATPLMQAAASLNPDLITLLVSRGADATAKDKTGNDALYQFIHWPRYKALEKPGFEARDAACLKLLEDLCGPLDHFAKSTIYTRRRHLIPLVPELMQVQEFVKVIEKNDTEALKTLLDGGTPPDFGTDFGAQSALTWAAEQNNIDMMDILMTRRADIEGWSQGMTPIMAAVRAGAKEAFLKLLYSGADTEKLFTYDRYPDTTLPELADIGKHAGMRAFVENAIAHRSDPLPEPDVAVDHPVTIRKPLRFMHKAASPAAP